MVLAPACIGRQAGLGLMLLVRVYSGVRGLGSGKVGSGAGNLKFEEVTFAGMGGGIHVEGGRHRWMFHVVNLMKATVFNHTPNSISPALFSSFIRI